MKQPVSIQNKEGLSADSPIVAFLKLLNNSDGTSKDSAGFIGQAP